MIATSIATWMLLVRLQSPLHPEEAARWNMNYSGIATPERCEDYAKTMWIKYYLQYSKTTCIFNQVFTTTCIASTVHSDYSWFIECDRDDNCVTKKHKEVKK